MMAEVPFHREFEQVLFLRDGRRAARAIVALHSTRLGPAFGGIRRWRYRGDEEALRDVLELARTMTWKCALADLPAGGGKAVILDEPGLDRRAAYELVGDAVAALGGRFHTGPDAGTTDADLRIVAERTRYCPGTGHGDIGGSTAHGVFAALRACARAIGRDLDGLEVLVQGVGAVGHRLCERLAVAGAKLIVADVDAGAADRVASAHGARVVAPAEALRTGCDLFVPCALGGVLDTAVAASLPARAVCGAANNVLADDEAGRILHARGIPVAPDFVANAGGLIHGVMVHQDGREPDAARLDRIGDVTAELLARSRREDVPPRELAVAVARARVAGA